MHKQHTQHMRTGFTLVELMVSVGIFAFMTALMVAKYGNFNQSVLLTNLAYDVAVTVRTAQSYGLSVKGFGAGTGEEKFQSAYGVHFNSQRGENTQFVLYVDNGGSGNAGYYLQGADEIINTYTLKRGAVIQWVCVDATCTDPEEGILDITFKRPDPAARIYYSGTSGDIVSASYSEITIQGTDGNTRKVAVRENGQISVLE